MRLMRYQSAAVSELSTKNKKEANPQDYLTFELRAIHRGAIGEIYNRAVVELITPRDGEVLTITPNHLGKEKSSDAPPFRHLALRSISICFSPALVIPITINLHTFEPRLCGNHVPDVAIQIHQDSIASCCLLSLLSGNSLISRLLRLPLSQETPQSSPELDVWIKVDETNTSESGS